jgi:hypothetical protein
MCASTKSTGLQLCTNFLMMLTAFPVISMYVSSSLHLEKRWFTRDPFFCLHTTLTVMKVTDAWRLSQYHKLISNAKDEDGLNVLIIKKFTGVLAKQLIKIAMSFDAASDLFLLPTAASRLSSGVLPLTSDDSTASSFTQTEFVDTMGKYHAPSLLPMTEQKSGKKYRCQRHCQWCKTKHGKPHCIVWTCHTCARPFCMPTGNNDGRNCFALFGQLKREANAVARRIFFL